VLVTRVLTHCQELVLFFGIRAKWRYRACFVYFERNQVKESLSTSDGGRREYGRSYDAFHDGRRWCPSDTRAGMEMGKTG